MTGRGPEGYARSTDRIEEDIHERLTRHGEIDASRIRISVENGEVTLEGTVRSRREKRMAEDTAEGVQGVHDVHNRLRVEERSGQGEGEAQEAGGQQGQREGRALSASGSGTGEAGAQGGRGRQKKAQASSRTGGSRSTKRSAGDQASQPGDAGQGEGGAAGEQTP